MGYSITYNSGTTTPFGTYKQGTITMGLKPDEYTVSSGFTWYANAETSNDNYLIISDTYSQGWSTQAESKPTIWRSETGTTESFVSLVNQLPDVNGVTGFTDSGSAMAYLQNSGKYFVSKDDYLGIVSDGLVLNLDAGWYPSYSGSGTTWKDLKGTNNGTLINGPTFSSENGGSIVFDGSNDYVVLPSSNLWAFGENGTVSMWSYFDGVRTTNHRWWCVNNNSFSLDAYLESGNIFGLHGNRTLTTVEYPRNQWVFVTVTYTNGNIKVYFNAEEQPIQGATSGYNITNSSTLFIGKYTSDGGYRWRGELPTMQIYNRGLSASEILQNYNATKGRFGL